MLILKIRFKTIITYDHTISAIMHRDAITKSRYRSTDISSPPPCIADTLGFKTSDTNYYDIYNQRLSIFTAERL